MNAFTLFYVDSKYIDGYFLILIVILSYIEHLLVSVLLHIVFKDDEISAEAPSQ